MKRYDCMAGYVENGEHSAMGENPQGKFVKLEDVLPLIEALKFYGDKNNWNERWATFDQSEGDVTDVIITDDVDMEENDDGPYLTYGGKTAREALKAAGVEG